MGIRGFANRIKALFTINTISARLSLQVGLVATLVLSCIVFLSTVTSFKTAKESSIATAKNELTLASLKIENILSDVMIVLDNLNWCVIEAISDKENSEKKIYDLTIKVIQNNPQIKGCCVAFVPNYQSSETNYYAPYSYRLASGEIESKDLGNARYDYVSREWYTTALKTKKPYWSLPYFDGEGSDEYMVTYVDPIFDEEGRIICFFTADIMLETLTSIAKNIKPYPGSTFFMVDQYANYIVTPDETLIMRKSSMYTDYFRSNLSKNLITDGTTDIEMYRYKSNEEESMVMFTKLIHHSSWRIFIFSPYEAIFGEDDKMLSYIVVVSIVGLVIMLVVCVYRIRLITKPITQISNALENIAKGDIYSPIPQVKAQYEVLQLRKTFEYMQSSLAENIKNLANAMKEKERVDLELSVARKIQKGLLVNIESQKFSKQSLDVDALLIPAREVGGDLYDIFIQNNKLYFSVGDVSGKGVPASIFMAISSKLFRFLSTRNSSASTILTKLNSVVSENNAANMFITIFVGILDLKTKQLTYSNAGHNPPILISAQNGVSKVSVKPNIPIGIVENYTYEEQEILLQEDDTLLLYTDGLNEAENSKNEFLGDKRIFEELSKHTGSRSSQIVKSLHQLVEEFTQGEEQSDDLTMLSIKLSGGKQEDKKQCLKIENNLHELEQLPEYIQKIFELYSLDITEQNRVNLAVEEALTNIIMYAYPKETKGDIEVSATYEKQTALLKIEIKDKGKEFNPLQKEAKPVEVTSPQEVSPGGLGIFLIKEIMNTVEYSRISSQNILTMSKKVKSK